MRQPPRIAPHGSGWRTTGSSCPSGPPPPQSSSWLWAPPPACAPGASGWSSWWPTAVQRSSSSLPSWQLPPSDRPWPAFAVPVESRRMVIPGPMTMAHWAGHPVPIRAPLPPMTRSPSRAGGPGHQTPGREPEESGPKEAGAGSAPPPNQY